MRPIDVVIQTVIYQEVLQLSSVIAAAGQTQVTVFVDTMAALNPAIVLR
jgi:hypothetical protein